MKNKLDFYNQHENEKLKIELDLGGKKVSGSIDVEQIINMQYQFNVNAILQLTSALENEMVTEYSKKETHE